MEGEGGQNKRSRRSSGVVSVPVLGSLAAGSRDKHAAVNHSHVHFDTRGDHSRIRPAVRQSKVYNQTKICYIYHNQTGSSEPKPKAHDTRVRRSW
jgi:hypothetical protein